MGGTTFKLGDGYGYLLLFLKHMKYIIDEIDEDKLMKIIRKFINHIYGKQLTMEENSSGYIRFYSVGPVPPFHRNLSGRLWMDDDRLFNIIEDFFSIDDSQTYALISFYFSNLYNIKITDVKSQPHIFFGVIDYSQFDDENHHIENEED